MKARDLKGQKPSVIRCAIYTRKSSEEGLEQDFNSLHAQREACEAYIKSQAHEGWKLVPAVYDDGGYSGGSLDRPALKKLLKDIEAHSIQVIVVYKVDRLTRSLADFARIVETLDQQGASFVSVTQQFNTTSSMGRLTLNVLLSFAQFEREVTGERIRDKIAASKKKGLWMGGVVPLGYRPDGRTLKIVPEEADLVRHLYQRYLVLGSVDELASELRRQGIKSKLGTSRRGFTYGGKDFSRGALYHLLGNPIYRGQIRHKDLIYPGQHELIIDQAQWDEVQRRLIDGARKNRGLPSANTEFVLAGKLFDNMGNHMTPSCSKKKTGERYRYYVSQAVLKRRSTDGIEVPRIGAETIERFVAEALKKEPAFRRQSLEKVMVGNQQVQFHFASSEDDPGQPSIQSLPVQLVPTNHETEIRMVGDSMGRPDPALVKALIRAWGWREKLESGEFRSIDSLSRTEQVNPNYITELIGLAFLPPDTIDSILNGNQSNLLSVKNARMKGSALSWRPGT